MTEVQLLQYIDSNPSPCDSLDFAKKFGITRDESVGLVKKLEIRNMIKTQLNQIQENSLTVEGESYINLGKSSEKIVLDIIHSLGKVSKKDLLGEIKKALSLSDDKIVAAIEKGGFAEAKKRSWVDIDKGSLIAKVNPDSVEDDTYTLLKSIDSLDKDTILRLKKRNLLEVKTVKYFTLEKGDDFALEVKSMGATDLTLENLRDGQWKSENFKPYNFSAKGKSVERGHFHQLLLVRSEFRKIFLELGFQEMKTSRFVENSFWNFDALFQPQQHPARDAHDTFFTSEPKTCLSLPDEEYVKRVRKVHESGGYGSIGYRYQWSLDVSKTNLLRTHTTAVSSRLLYDLAQEYKKTGVFTPKKFFSIDRVFRNETTDETHLCEFHQIEGMVIDRGLSLGDMIGLLAQFFAKIGITDLRFKPAYNPYTEPSMEIFGFHPQLNKWTEIGNSGMFRPEMLEPMGMPSDVVVLAWGLSLERPTMINYGIRHIQDLMGHTVEVSTFENEEEVSKRLTGNWFDKSETCSWAVKEDGEYRSCKNSKSFGPVCGTHRNLYFLHKTDKKLNLGPLFGMKR